MLLKMRNAIKRYGDLIAVDHVDLDVKEGELFGLLGPNGAGKTSIINMLIGLTRVDGGEIEIFGKNLKNHAAEIKKDIGIVPQEIALFEDLTAEENITYFGKLYGLKGVLLKERVTETLNFVGLWEKRKIFPKKYSGGMKRRLNIACGIMHHPKLIIMDEPTVGIDPQSRSLILDSIRKLNSMGATVIYTSHYMEEVEELCTEIVIMDHGRVIAKGSKEELKTLVKEEDKVVVTVVSVRNSVVEKIKKISGVIDCQAEKEQITVRSAKNSSNLSRIIEVVTNTNSELLTVEIEKPTLESVFLTLTGKSLRD